MGHVQLFTRSLMLTGLLVVSAGAQAGSVNVDLLPEESRVTFKAYAPLLTIEGSGKGVTGKFKISGPQAIEGKATLQLEGLTTDMSLRDKHMKSEKTLNIVKFPEAMFVPTKLPWQDPSQVLKKDMEKGPFEGKLTLHGIEKPVNGEVSTKVLANKVTYTFQFQVLLSQYDIPLPQFSGVKVKDQVEVIVETPAKVVAQ